MAAETIKTEKGVLKKGMTGGPHGLGDPEDQSLRKVELNVMIPKIIRERSMNEKCVAEYEAFEACGKVAGLAGWLKCREENSRMQKCYEYWFAEPNFVQECKELYLHERTEFRRTGMVKPKVERLGSKENKAFKRAERAKANLANETAEHSHA